MGIAIRIGVLLIAAGILIGCAHRTASVQPTNSLPSDRPDPREIPVPEIPTALGVMPGVNDLPVRVEMPDVMTMNDGTRVSTVDQWKQRRAEMMRILEYYAVGLAPPPPGNVAGEVTKTQLVLNGRVKYRLVHLTFGPQQSLSLNIGIFTPVEGGPFPAIIMPGGTPPGAPNLPRLGQGATQGQNADALMSVGPSTRPASAATRRAGSTRRGFFGPTDPQTMAASSPALAHGFALVTFNNSDCGEDTTLRNPDGSWAFRNTRFFPAYPGYDWGLLRCWAWGVSRIVDYLQTDPTIDANKLIVSGVSRTGKSALIAGAFDDRLAMVAPVASSGGGTPAYRFSGAGRGGKEGLSDMMRKYPNWFSPHLHPFWGNADKLPFDEHWFIALCAPRPFIALEGLNDQNVNANGVRQSWLAAQPAYELFNATDRLGVSWAKRPHGMVRGDWDALLAFADKFLLNKPVDRSFDYFPTTQSAAADPETPTSVRAFGAVGDGKTKDTSAFQTALDQCSKSGGGEVTVPAGDYLIGSIELKSNTTLRLEKGANLLGSPDLADYPIVKARWEGQWVDAYRGLIFAADATNIAVVGPGKIVGSEKLGGRAMPRRPCVIEPINCSGILLEDFSTQQERMWTIHPTLCRNVVARRLTIRSKTGNGDGIDLDSCENVRVENCDIDTGDDCVALKSGRGLEAWKAAKPTENVLITRCKLGDRVFACVGIGSETSGGVRNVRIEHCEFTHSKTYSIYIKSHIGRGASIENISGTDLDVESATRGFLRINLISSGRTDTNPVPGDKGIPLGSNFAFSDIKVANCGSLIEGTEISPRKPVDGLTISNLFGNSQKGIVLANMINVSLSRINVKITKGALISMLNVKGVGLEGAVPYNPPPPTTRNQ